MFSLSWLSQRGLTRGRPSARRRVAKAVALSGLILVTMLQTGCRSSGMRSGCGLFSACGFPARATSRIVQPFRNLRPSAVVGGDCCPDAAYGAPVEYGVPVGVVGGVPMGAPATVIDSGSPVPSVVSPPASGAETELDPIPPSARPGDAPGRSSQSGSSLRRPANYDSKRPVENPGVNLTSAKASDRISDRDYSSPLDNLGPLDIPLEIPEPKDSPPVAPAASKMKTTAPAATAPTSTPASASVSASLPSTTLSSDHQDGRSVGGTGEKLTPPPAPPTDPAPQIDDDAQPEGALGVSRFQVVDLKLAAGSVPSTVGLGWLAEKGYRTVLDLRDASKIESNFIGEAAKRGLRYISLPTDLTNLSKDHLERFSAELSLDAARPLYFFDDDGRIAGSLWYIRRVLNEKSAFDVARRQAEQIGLVDAESWKLTHDYVKTRISTATSSPAATPDEPDSRPQTEAQAVKTPTVPLPTVVVAPIPTFTPTAYAAVTQTSDVWQPLAAMLLTGLTFRAAFIGRAAMPSFRLKARASLPE